MIRKKRADFNFVWIFAIIAGVAILFLALYGAIKGIEVKTAEQGAEAAKEISILTDPMQAGFAQASYGQISFTQDAIINNKCYNEDGFGKNDISVMISSGIGKKWGEITPATSVHNKYIFSSNNSGKVFHVFSKSFEFPFKVSDIIFVTSNNYCFIDPPSYIADEIEGLKIKNIHVGSIENCSEKDTRVCFAPGFACDMVVYGNCVGCKNIFEEGYVIKNNSQASYVGALMYGAIFSDFSDYNCNVQRLLFRAGKIADLYSKKIDILRTRGIDSNIQPDLNSFSSVAMNASEKDLVQLSEMAKQLDKNKEKESRIDLW